MVVDVSTVVVVDGRVVIVVLGLVVLLVLVVASPAAPPHAAASTASVARSAGVTLLMTLRRSRGRIWVTGSLGCFGACARAYPSPMATTRVLKHIRAPRDVVYEAIIDAAAVQRWMVPDGMTSEVHHFEAQEGGTFRISLTYDDPTSVGKTGANTDSFQGRFAKLVPGREVIQVVEFDSDDPDTAGEMTITYSLSDAAEGGTNLTGIHENLPPGLRPEDNEQGWQMSIDKLARLVEGQH